MSSWILFTLFAAVMQAIRTAGQKQLTSSLSPMSSTMVRYVFGWPFALIYLYLVTREDLQAALLHALQQSRFITFAIMAGIAQILATYLLIKTFNFRNFAVGTGFAKTEAIQAAAFGALFFGSQLNVLGWLAVLLGVIGILIVSVPEKKLKWEPLNVLFGTLSGCAFALTSLWLREASLSLEFGVVQSAAVTLFVMVSLQSCICVVYSVVKEPGQISLIRQRKSLATFVGATSALGSVGWFTAMTYQDPALVKSLGQIEFIFTVLITTLFFKEVITRREYIGVGTIALSVVLLLLPFKVTKADAQTVYRQFPAPEINFDSHVNKLKTHLLATQMPQRSAEDVQYNLPFELAANPVANYRGKFLLIHGLNDSPYVWRDMADELSKLGFDVRVILLPGHGNTPKAQLKMSYKLWLTAARQHLALYREPDKPFYLGGFSLGGVIATLLAIESDPVDGLLLFSPAYKSTRDHLLRWAGIYSRFQPWVFGNMIIEDNPTKYNSIPINSASQYYKTTRKLKKKWPKKPIDVPVLMVAASKDSVLSIAYMEKVFDKRFSGNRKMIIYDNEKTGQSSEQVEYRNGYFPTLRVLNQSHQSVLISPTNPLFGAGGAIKVCNGNDWKTFSTCLYHPGGHWFGAQGTESPDGVPVARSTYNPDFDYIVNQVDVLFR